MNEQSKTPSRRPAWLAMTLAGVFALSACDRNTAPPQQPKTHIIELSRGDTSPTLQANAAAKAPYGAEAPMAQGTDGVQVAADDATRVRVGLDQSPLPTGTPEAIVNSTPTGAGAASPTGAVSVALSATEMAFLTQATEAGLFDLRMGQLGVERASNTVVKSYAAMLVADQASLNSGLQQLARKLSVPLPNSLSEPKQQMVDSLARTGTVEFDQQFVSAVGARDHAQTIELFERTGRDTRHPLVRAFVLNALPTLRAHLNAAERLPVKG